MKFKNASQRKAVMAKLNNMPPGYYQDYKGQIIRDTSKPAIEAYRKKLRVENKNMPLVTKPMMTESEVNLLMRRINAGKIKPSDLSKNKLIYDGEGIKLTQEQSEKGRRWLLDKWKSPTGKERKGNPYGYREQDIIDNFREIRLADTYPSRYGNYHHPLYRAYSTKGDTMDYYIEGGNVNIVG